MVYVDDAHNRFGRMIMCHMISDTEEELHEMAKLIGMSRDWFQPKSFPHYDLSLSRRKLAVRFGAIEVSQKVLVMKIKELRNEKSKRENSK